MQIACDTNDIGPTVCSIVSLGKSVDNFFRTQRLLEQRGHKNDLTTTTPCRPATSLRGRRTWRACWKGLQGCNDLSGLCHTKPRRPKGQKVVWLANQNCSWTCRKLFEVIKCHQWVKHVNKLKHLDGSTKPSREMLNITNPQWPSLKLVGHGQSFHGVVDEKIPSYGEMYRMLCL